MNGDRYICGNIWGQTIASLVVLDTTHEWPLILEVFYDFSGISYVLNDKRIMSCMSWGLCMNWKWEVIQMFHKRHILAETAVYV